MNFEMNNIRRDAEYTNGKIRKTSKVVEVFAAMVNGESLDKFAKVGDQAVAYIKELGARAENGDFSAVSELNTIRKFVMEPTIMEEMKLLNIFGTYQNIGYDETAERDIFKTSGERSREQAAGGDVVFPVVTKETYSIPTFTISGGYAVDYRRVSLGDMSRENIGMEQVKTDILNRAKAAIVKKVYNAIKNATGIKYHFAGAGLTQTGVDTVINNVRRNGRTTVIGDYALISQFNSWAGYVGSISGNTITGVSQKTLDEIAQTGIPQMYKGTVLWEMPNPYNEYELKADGSNFETMLPAGLGFVIPTGVQSPILTLTRGGLTSLSGNDIKTGKILTRYDVEIGIDVAKGQEHKIGVILDTNLSTF